MNVDGKFPPTYILLIMYQQNVKIKKTIMIKSDF